MVSVFCCWLGWETSVVRERQTLLKQLRANPAVRVTSASEWASRFPPGNVAQDHVVKISLLREWLGDQAIQQISFDPNIQGVPELEIHRLVRVFPEAVLPPKELPNFQRQQEPCHPGCFPRGTLVETPQGLRAIESIRPGDSLIAILPDGESVTVSVQSVFVTDNRLWKVETDDGVLITTETQPLCLTTDRIRPAGKLQPGDTILRRQDGNILSVKVLAVTRTDRTEKVFNLVLGDSESFVADGFLARSKPPAEIATQ